jgi:hypothetical protein
VRRVFQKILSEKEFKEGQADRFDPKNINKVYNNNMGISFHTTDKLKIIYKQNQMLLSFSCLFFTYVE